MATATMSGTTLVVEEWKGASRRSRAAVAAIGRARPAVSAAVARANRLRALPLYGIETVERAAALLRPPRGTRVRRVKLQRCPAEWVIARPNDDRDTGQAVVLYFHGGLFLAAGLRTHRRLVARISAAAGGAAVLNVAYRLVPKAVLADMIDDGLAAYRWLLDQGVPASRIVVAGDSAGGFLAFAVPLAARDAGLPAPAGLVGLSPMTDLDHAARDAHANAALDPFMTPEVFRLFDRHVASGRLDPSLAPVHANLAGLPPVLMQLGSIEVLLADAEKMAERLTVAGVPCKLQIWEGQFHDFQVAADLLPEGRAAIGEIAAFIRRVTRDKL